MMAFQTDSGGVVLVPESSRLYVFGGSRYIRVMEAYLQQD